MDTMTDLDSVARDHAILAGFLDAFSSRIFSSPVYNGGHVLDFNGLGRFEAKTFMECAAKAYQAWAGGEVAMHAGPITMMNHYAITPIRSIEEIRGIFDDKTDYSLNWLFLSTSGVHGSYRDLDDIEKGWDLPEDHDDACGREITVLAVLPRLVLVKYGSVEIEKSDIPWLRNAATRTLEGVARSAEGNLEAAND